MVEEMRRQTEDIIRYYGEIDRRVAHTGLDGIAGLLEMSHHIEFALGVVATQELEWMMSEVRGLLERLVRMDSQLQALRALKASFGDDADVVSSTFRPR
jgi:hypothetical protein